MNIVKNVLLLVMSVNLLFGCASAIKLGPVEDIAQNRVTIHDKRPEAEKESYRSSNDSPLVILGDEDFDVSPQAYLKNALYMAKPEGVTEIEAVINKFILADYFPQRLQSARNGAMYGVFGAAGAIFEILNKKIDRDADSILCKLDIELNGKPANVSVAISYKISPHVFMVRRQEEWIDALKTAISKCAISAFGNNKVL